MSSTVTCGYSAADWEKNSAGQNACQVYAQLEGLCNPSFSIGDVTPTSAPYTPNNDACSCNIVAYNLMAGCAWCQSSIQTSWWLTISQWSGNCTSASFDATGIPGSVSGAGQINIPAWALSIPSGTTWSPSDAQLAAESATPGSSTTSTTATAGGGGATTGRATTTTNPFGTSRSTTNYAGYTYTGGALSGGDDYNFQQLGTDVGKAVGIAFGVILGLYALMGIIIGLVYFNRQKSRQAWYGPMAQYYRDRGMGMGGQQTMYGGYVAGVGAQAAAPLIHNQEGAPTGYYPSASPNHTIHSSNTGTNTTGYQPPPQDPSNPFATPYGTPHPTPGAYQPPPPEMGGWAGHQPGQPGTATTAGNTTSIYGTAQTNVYAPPAAPPGGYKGHAEVY